MVSPARCAFPVVGDPVCVGPDVGVELTHRLDQSDLFESGLAATDVVELALKVLGGLRGAEDVAVLDEPFEGGQALADLGGEVASHTATRQ